MYYEKELSFFINIMEACSIKSQIVTSANIPFDIDYGIRISENLQADYLKQFSLDDKPRNKITKLIDTFQSTYFFIPLPQTENNKTLIIGPYMDKAVSSAEIEAGSTSLSLLPSAIKNIQKYFDTVPYIQDDSFINNAVKCFSDIILPESGKFTLITADSDIFDASIHIRNKQVDESESPIASIQAVERAYEMENKLLNAVSQGLAHKAEAVFGKIKPSSMLEARFTDKLRNAKNFMLVLNTLSRKAVEQSGVHPIYIDSISTDFSLKIESAPNVDECDKLFFEMIKKYSLLVQQHSHKGYSLLVQRVITSIDTDITADLSLKNMAKLLNVNPSYLSTLFKKETGITLTEYVNKKRIERAKKLLKSGDLQIQTVAQSCGMLDVNYFTKLFKKHTGVTPKEYKNI